jgi:hypothetical protein
MTRQANLVTFVLAVIVAAILPAAALCADIGKIPWTESNVETLRAFDKAAIVRFINALGGADTDTPLFPANTIEEFSWIDLAGDGRYALALIELPGTCCSDLIIYQQDASGHINSQLLEGAGRLSNTIRDVNADGKKELIIPPPALHPDWESFGAVTEIIWPRVYRLENGKYVEASGEFAGYYDAEVLPPIENAISQARFRLEHGPIGAKPTTRWVLYMQHKIAGLSMERDKILRVIGRDPNAGLKQAREWMNSPDAALVQDAITVFRDVGEHESDLRAATGRLKEECCDFYGFGPSALRGDRAEADWLTYTNAKNGLSFRYPPSMRVEERDPVSFHFDHPPEAIVDVRGPGTILRFICGAGVKTPEMAAATLRRSRKQSSEDERPCDSMQIDGHEAFVGGPFNGPWSVNILQSRACEVFPMADGSDDAPPPHDGKFPLLSIVRTVHFESVVSRQQAVATTNCKSSQMTW